MIAIPFQDFCHPTACLLQPPPNIYEHKLNLSGTGSALLVQAW